MIAALFVESEGCYFNDDRIDPYDINRDAILYSGFNPVIAHPPCQLWGKLAKVNYARWPGDHNKPGNDGGKFKFALDCVNRCGGVLEHPAGSYAFMEYGIVKPEKNKWLQAGLKSWVCEVWQSAYGHKANKATWLYYSGILEPFDMDWSRPKGDFQIGFQDRRGKEKNKPTLNKKEANATPFKFKEELIKLAYWSRGKK